MTIKMLDDTCSVEPRLSGCDTPAQVTVIIGCTYEASARSIVSALYTLDYSPLALTVTAAFADGPWEADVQAGWWQGEYVLEPVAWHQSMISRGSYSGLTSAEFEQRFQSRYGEAVSYLGASQFAACCALSRRPARSRPATIPPAPPDRWHEPSPTLRRPYADLTPTLRRPYVLCRVVPFRVSGPMREGLHPPLVTVACTPPW